MTADNELLEMAGKAAGLKVQYSNNFGDFSIGEPYSHGEIRWNPLTDDGDALRLMVKLKMCIYRTDAYLSARTSGGDQIEFIEMGEDPGVLTRRAIVREAARIGRAMP